MKISNRIRALLICMSFLFIALLINHFVDFHITDHFEGIYLLKGDSKNRFLVTDHLFVGHEKKIILSKTFDSNYCNLSKKLSHCRKNPKNHLHVVWNRSDGSGYVSNQFSDGSGLVTYLGRFIDDDTNNEVHGLFVGGELPETLENISRYKMNDSGMTYFDNKKWYHIWCSVNEGIGSPLTGVNIQPSKWEYIGSGIESQTSEKVVITSSHKVVIDGIPVKIDRKCTFTAGEPYFTLEILITNIGTKLLFYNYLYGDEPWIGEYGNSLGDVGWVKDRIVNYEEMIDTSKYSFIGMADLGNRVIGEKPVYTNLANFIEWFGSEKPNYAYFTNKLEHFPTNAGTVPLDSNERFEGLQWDRFLAPKESATIRIAIGMAKFNPKTGIPEKPQTSWK